MAATEDIRAAVETLRAKLAERPDPETRLSLARLLHLVDTPASRAELERAHEEFLQAGARKRAAVAASRLGVYYRSGVGNRIAARAWFGRAWRLLDEEGPCLERGWVAAADIGCNADDPVRLRERAHIALEMGRRFGDVALEAKALADSGLALVELGELREGFERLDEAMALVTAGSVHDPIVVAQSCCTLFTACHHAGDLERIEGWSSMLAERDLLGDRGIPTLNGHCGAVHGKLLSDLGRWDEAEAALEAAIETARHLHFSGRLRATTALADLRIRQGRLDEAELLLLGIDDHMDALIPAARLHLERGELDLAVAIARRGLRMLGDDRVRAVGLLAVICEAEVRRGDLDAAAAACTDLEARAASPRLPALDATAAVARARVATARGDSASAERALEGALAALSTTPLALAKAKVHAELARVHATSDKAAARIDARAALAIHARVGAALSASEVERLQELAGDATREQTRAIATLRPAERGWILSIGASTFQLRDAKGLHYVAELVAHPGVDRHVFDLVELTDPADADAPPRAAGGDAGPALDAAAKTAYRRRIETLRETIEDAESRGDHETSARASDEIEAIVRELSRAVGLGGRDRRIASGAERARVNVTRAVRSAIERITELDAAAGAALDGAIRTGVFCSYNVAPDASFTWKIEPLADVPSKMNTSERK